MPLRKDWEDLKADIMRKAGCEKFIQNEAIKKLILETYDEKLVEYSPIDYYWGCGKNSSVRNTLGIFLMKVRDKLRAEQG